MLLGNRPQEHPIRSLVTLYVGWKALLLLVAACSPGPGYDTSASLAEPGQGPELPLALRYIVGKLTRWDALYFVQISTRGYLFEQEWAFGWGFTRGSNTASHDLLVLFSGICFGIATSFRSNGILNGTLLLEEAFKALYDLRNGLKLPRVRRLVATGLGGMSVGAGFGLPQYIAYGEYCGGQDTVARPWCERTIPSIYAFVQDHYWDCGLFRYWKLSNLPLFLLAAPMLAILTVSGLWGLIFAADGQQKPTTTHEGNRKDHETRKVVRNLAFSQLMLVIVTLTTAHVQIITRISSAYPVWLWYGSLLSRDRNTLIDGNLVQFMVIYALVQGALFASFLPPA
ncbi:glycosyltransferase family 76 protein [Diplocarpon rosae]|nr:glycosyltransferase family 76 protein [Diplocarpon rosae]